VIRRGVKIQLVIFAVITLLGVSFVGARYAGLADPIVRPGYNIAASFTDSGGIFEGAEVTYRGLEVGKVGPLRLTKDGVLVALRIDKGVNVPNDARAIVRTRSAVGEQYVDLQPQRNGGPYLRAGDVIPPERTGVPLRVEALLLNFDRLVNSVGKDDLATVIDELGKAFAGTAPNLQRFLDSSSALTTAATEALPETVRLIEDGNTVLKTQVDQAGHIRSFARDLATLTDALRASDADFRRLLDVGPPAGKEIRDLVEQLDPQFSVLFSNLITVSQVSSVRIPQLKALFAAYPIAVAGSKIVIPGDGTVHTSIETAMEPSVCTQGYGGTDRRDPAELEDTPANTKAGCSLPKGNPSTVRGTQHAPGPSERGRVAWDASPPSSAATTAGEPELVGYDPRTGRVFGPDGVTFVMGAKGGQQGLLGEDSWKWLLLGPVAR
jgi:phospholipid/cholesterol/gamma-HCH transport system substrate-binding protein